MTCARNLLHKFFSKDVSKPLTALRPRVTSTKLAYRNTISTTFYRVHLQKKNTSVGHHAIILKVTWNTRSAWVDVWRTYSTILKVSLCRLQIPTWVSQEKPLWGCGKCCGNGIIMIMSGIKVQNGLTWQGLELFVALLFSFFLFFFFFFCFFFSPMDP